MVLAVDFIKHLRSNSSISRKRRTGMTTLYNDSFYKVIITPISKTDKLNKRKEACKKEGKKELEK